MQKYSFNFNKAILNSLCAIICSVAYTTCAYAQGSEKADEEKPLIGMNIKVDGEKPVQYIISSPYSQAILKSGGIPILIPPMGIEPLKQLFSKLDGVIMIGGRDYPPFMYDKTINKTINLMPERRSSFDSRMAKLVLNNPKLPFLGICAGAQILNIKSGGSLIRDIPTSYPDSNIEHASDDGWINGWSKHKVVFDKDCKLAKIFNSKNLTVVSAHHQCFDKIGKDLKITSRASDGVPESYEHKDNSRFFIGLQWHPERGYKTNKPLFDEFVKQCKSYKKKRIGM